MNPGPGSGDGVADYHDAMANWTDGPEYAPPDRPAAFQTPLAEPLEIPVPAPNLAAGAPLTPPAWQPPRVPTVALDALVPAAGPEPRDPRTAFATVSSPVTGASAWGSAHTATGAAAAPEWTPDQPLGPVPPPAPAPDAAGRPTAPMQLTQPLPPGVNFPPPQPSVQPFPQPGTPDWFAPPPQEHWQPPNQTVTVGQMWRGATPGLMVPLIIGAIVTPLSVAMFAIAALLSARVRYRRQQARKLFSIVAALLAMIGVLALFNADFELDVTWSVLSSWTQVACWVVGIVTPLLVGAGIRANEPPEQGY